MVEVDSPNVKRLVCAPVHLSLLVKTVRYASKSLMLASKPYIYWQGFSTKG